MEAETTRAAAELYDLVEELGWDELRLTVEDARLLLYRRCLDAGWSETKTARYMNKVLPLSDQRVSR